MLLRVSVNLPKSPGQRGFSVDRRFAVSAVPWRSHGAVGASVWYWELSSSYERVVWAAERAYGTPEFGVGAVLCGAFRGRSAARVRVGLECVQKSVP